MARVCRSMYLLLTCIREMCQRLAQTWFGKHVATSCRLSVSRCIANVEKTATMRPFKVIYRFLSWIRMMKCSSMKRKRSAARHELKGSQTSTLVLPSCARPFCLKTHQLSALKTVSYIVRDLPRGMRCKFTQRGLQEERSLRSIYGRVSR